MTCRRNKMAVEIRDVEADAISPHEDGEPETLQNIDLQSPPKQSVYQPTLQFSDTIAHEMSGSGEVVTESPIEGTELHSRQRTPSRGAQLKEWSTHHMKVTKQLVSEKIGRSTRTIDPNLEQRIESLKETQKKYAQLIELSLRFHFHFGNVVEMQKSLAENFAFMSVRTPELHTEFHFNSETQKTIARNGETLLAAFQFFASNMQTVSTKTMDDTLQTVKGYETARLSYDAYRNELEELKKQANTSEKAAGRLPQATAEFEKHKAKFEQLRQDVDIKLKLLDENKLKVSHKQLVLIHGAFAAYFSGNHKAIETLLREFNAKMEEDRRGNDPPAWLEDLPSPQHDGHSYNTEQ